MRNPLSPRERGNGVSVVSIIVIAVAFVVVSVSHAASIKLNDEGQSFSDVGAFAISPDGSRVLYTADQETSDVFELFSVPLLGPASSGVKLNGSLVADGDVSDFKISPDSRWAVYRADQHIDGEAFGYRAPLAGPAGRDEGIWSVPDTSMSGGSSSYLIDPTSQQVVVRGGWAFLDDIKRLWSCILAGTPDFGGKMLSDPLVAGGMVVEFDMSSDGRFVVYRADQDVDDTTELYAVILPILFRDGFEFGDTSAWSSTRPRAGAKDKPRLYTRCLAKNRLGHHKLKPPNIVIR